MQLSTRAETELETLRLLYQALKDLDPKLNTKDYFTLLALLETSTQALLREVDRRKDK